MKTPFFVYLLCLIVGSSALSSSVALANPENWQRLDFDQHYRLKQESTSQDLSSNRGPASDPNKTRLGNVSEERNTSPSMNRALGDPYHRTLRTGLTF